MSDLQRENIGGIDHRSGAPIIAAINPQKIVMTKTTASAIPHPVTSVETIMSMQIDLPR